MNDTAKDMTLAPDSNSLVPSDLKKMSAAERTTALIETAVSQNIEPAALRELVELQKDMMSWDARTEFFRALHLLQRDLEPINKVATAKISTAGGGSYTYNYAPLHYVEAQLRPLLDMHHFSYTFSTNWSPDGGRMLVTCNLRHIAGHCEPTTFPVSTKTNAAMSDGQKDASATTLGKRHALLMAVGASTGEPDNDGAGPGRENEPKISEEQAATMKALAEEVGADIPKFLRWLQVERFADINASRYDKAVRGLESKRAQQ